MKEPSTGANESNSITIEIRSGNDNDVTMNNNSITESSPDTTQTEGGTLKMSDKTELLAPNDDGNAKDGVDNPAFENDTQMSNGKTMAMLSNGGDSHLLNYSNCERKLKDDSDYKTTEEMAEAVNLELMNMSSNLSNGFNGTNGLNGFNGFNGINGIPVKSPHSTVINMTNPYDEYFIPVNEHRKYMRGEKLYVTKSKRDIENSKNRCCVWLIGLVTTMIAICLAILIASESDVFLRIEEVILTTETIAKN